MEAGIRSRVQACALSVVASVLFAPVFSAGETFPLPLAFLCLLVVTGPATWWLIVTRPESAGEQWTRFGDAGRGYVLAFVVFWGGLRTSSAFGIQTVSVGGRVALLTVSLGGGYWLGYQAKYRSVLATLREAWIKDLSEEERRELESLRNEDSDPES